MTTTEAWQAKSRLDEQEIRDLQRELELDLVTDRMEQLQEENRQRLPVGLIFLFGLVAGLGLVLIHSLLFDL